MYNRADLECLEQNGSRNVHLLAALGRDSKGSKNMEKKLCITLDNT